MKIKIYVASGCNADKSDCAGSRWCWQQWHYCNVSQQFAARDRYCSCCFCKCSRLLLQNLVSSLISAQGFRSVHEEIVSEVFRLGVCLWRGNPTVFFDPCLFFLLSYPYLFKKLIVLPLIISILNIVEICDPDFIQYEIIKEGGLDFYDRYFKL